MRSTPPVPGSPRGLSEIYQRHVLADSIVSSVVEKEGSREYPLDRLNDMRALINYGPEYGAQCVARRDYLVSVAAESARMAIGRLLRMHMELMATLGVMERLGSQDTDGIVKLVSELGDVLVHRVKDSPLEEDMSSGVDPKPVSAMAGESSKYALSIAWKCGELADRLGMGEHVIYAHSHVLVGERKRVIRRGFFHQRRSHHFPHRVVTGTELTSESSYAFEASIFRARASRPIPPADRAFFEVFVDGVPVADVSELRALDGAISVGLQRVCAHEERVAMTLDLDVRKMLIYSAELRDADRVDGGIWKLTETAFSDIALRRITRRLDLGDDQAYGRVFFELIEQGLALLQTASGGRDI
jgi:hypothetical protein